VRFFSATFFTRWKCYAFPFIARKKRRKPIRVMRNARPEIIRRTRRIRAALKQKTT
jgi:hypothetical protein